MRLLHLLAPAFAVEIAPARLLVGRVRRAEAHVGTDCPALAEE